MNDVSAASTATVVPATVGLLTPIDIRGVKLRSRIALSPMCQYSSFEGLADDWHLVHLGSRAVGGAALVFTEATSVAREGRITPGDLGLWHDAHMEPLRRIVQVIERRGAVPGIQLAHAGRKASKQPPWRGSLPLASNEGAWPIVGASPLPFDDKAQTPIELSSADIDGVVAAFEAAAQRAVAIGFKVIEVHAAHGYLLHQFLSPISNHRRDDYGGSLDNRMRLLLRVVERIRAVTPDRQPLFVRISATDWIEGEPAWDLDQSVTLARQLKAAGVDLIDVSSSGSSLRQKVVLGPGYQVPFARRIRADAHIMTGAVGLITEPRQANDVIARGDADLVFVGRAFLRNPYWGLIAQEELAGDAPWPEQYGYAVRRAPR
jgi:2,4-dienoyl-CoA reductase-like NADH-dependent reductase (Old Yellow Enzyme family)